MKVNKKSISSSGYASGASAYGKTQKASAAESVRDSIEVSESAGLFRAAVALAAQTPDVRLEATAGIQDEFANNRYHRNEYQVAEKVIQDQLGSPLPAF